MGPDGIPSKFMELSANVIDSNLTYIINKVLLKIIIPKKLKLQALDQFSKKMRQQTQKYRPASLLNVFSKIVERFIYENLILI